MYSSPVRHSSASSKLDLLPFDLHVLGMPPAFNLSQYQTLQFKTETLKCLIKNSELIVKIGMIFVIAQSASSKSKLPLLVLPKSSMQAPTQVIEFILLKNMRRDARGPNKTREYNPEPPSPTILGRDGS
jgi:hypothetical protein